MGTMSAESCKNLVASSLMDECPPTAYTPPDSLTVQEAELREWDTFLARTPGGSYQQTGAWAIAKLADGYRARRFAIKRGEVTVGGAQMLIRKLPVYGAVAYVPLGPVLASDDPEAATLALRHLHRIAGERKVRCLVVQPPRGMEAFARNLQNEGFSRAFVALAPNASVVIDLFNSLDAILSKMRKATRHHIRASQRNGIVIREGQLEDIDAFDKVLLATAKRQDFSKLEKDYLCEVWRQFSRGGHINMFLAEYEGQPVSAILTMAFGDTVTYWRGGWSGEHGNRYPNEAVHWAAMQWAKSRGYRYYDFGGIPRGVAERVLAGEAVSNPAQHSVAFYKLGFGGQIEVFPEALIYIYNQTLRRLWSRLSQRELEQTLLRKMLRRVVN